jgi:hypothetical protein
MKERKIRRKDSNSSSRAGSMFFQRDGFPLPRLRKNRLQRFQLQIDHIIPHFSRGAVNDISNLQNVVQKPANRRKKGSTGSPAFRRHFDL